MVKYLAPALLALASCATPGPGEKRVDIVLRNDVDRPIEVRASVGIFSQRLYLAPGQEWRGWIPTDIPGGQVRVEVSEDTRLRSLKIHQ